MLSPDSSILHLVRPDDISSDRRRNRPVPRISKRRRPFIGAKVAIPRLEVTRLTLGIALDPIHGVPSA